MTDIGQDVVSDLIATIKWPDDWGEENKKDFYVWIKNTVQQTSGFQTKKKLDQLVDSLVEIEQGKKKKEDE